MKQETIYLGRHKAWGTTYLTKHVWDCGWYWGFGYLGNRGNHWHFDSLLGADADIRKHFTETWLNQKQWWILRDLFISAYALKKAAEVYRYGGHQTNDAEPYRVTDSTMAEKLNKDLEKILDNIWNLLHEWENDGKTFVIGVKKVPEVSVYDNEFRQ